MAASYEIICADARIDPRSGYFEPDDQPASIVPYTDTDDNASRNNMPIDGSATCSSTAWWAIVTTPPTGTIVKMRRAGNRASTARA